MCAPGIEKPYVSAIFSGHWVSEKKPVDKSNGADDGHLDPSSARRSAKLSLSASFLRFSTPPHLHFVDSTATLVKVMLFGEKLKNAEKSWEDESEV